MYSTPVNYLRPPKPPTELTPQPIFAVLGNDAFETGNSGLTSPGVGYFYRTISESKNLEGLAIALKEYENEIPYNYIMKVPYKFKMDVPAETVSFLDEIAKTIKPVFTPDNSQRVLVFLKDCPATLRQDLLSNSVIQECLKKFEPSFLKAISAS